MTANCTEEEQIDEFLLTALQNPRDRLTLLKLDQELEKFVNDPKQVRKIYPPMSSYHRLILHRIAQHYKIDHPVIETEPQKRSVVLIKTPESRVPFYRLHQICEREELPSKSVKIMQRKEKKATPTPISLPPTQGPGVMSPLVASTTTNGTPFTIYVLKDISNGNSVSSDFRAMSSVSDEQKQSSTKSYEERELAYQLARARIFNSESKPETNLEEVEKEKEKEKEQEKEKEKERVPEESMIRFNAFDQDFDRLDEAILSNHYDGKNFSSLNHSAKAGQPLHNSRTLIRPFVPPQQKDPWDRDRDTDRDFSFHSSNFVQNSTWTKTPSQAFPRVGYEFNTPTYEPEINQWGNYYSPFLHNNTVSAQTPTAVAPTSAVPSNAYPFGGTYPVKLPVSSSYLISQGRTVDAEYKRRPPKSTELFDPKAPWCGNGDKRRNTSFSPMISGIENCEQNSKDFMHQPHGRPRGVIAVPTGRVQMNGP